MGIIEIEKTFFFSSSASNGAVNIRDKGSAFEVVLDTPMTVPPGALSCSIECRSANIWFIMPNISGNDGYKNNRLYFKYDPSIIGAFNINDVIFGPGALVIPTQPPVPPIDLVTVPIVPTTVTANSAGWDYLELPDGLYSVSDLNSSLRRLMGNKYIPNTTTRYSQSSITISANASTQRIIVEMDPGFILGVAPYQNNICKTFGITIKDPEGIKYLHANDYWEAESIAQLTPINSFLIHSDIIENGLRVNNGVANILTEIQLSGPPGSFLTYRPYLPYQLNGDHLKFGTRDTVRFYITDDKNRPIDMFGEAYSFSVIIKYKIDVSATTNTGFTQTFRRS